jgi:Tol biopolymer transport system component
MKVNLIMYFYKETNEDAVGTDIMGNEKFDSPQKPFGGDEDYLWSPDSKKILYVSKKKTGTAYAISTNTSIFEYSLETTGLTEQSIQVMT